MKPELCTREMFVKDYVKHWRTVVAGGVSFSDKDHESRVLATAALPDPVKVENYEAIWGRVEILCNGCGATVEQLAVFTEDTGDVFEDNTLSLCAECLRVGLELLKEKP